MMLNIHGQRYTTSAQGDTIGRFFGAMEGHGGTLLFYLPVFLLGFFPWSGLLPFAWYQSYRRENTEPLKSLRQRTIYRKRN
jgi:4-amino-4-deoxy-L-arabinose transferase-like glycosyltransferase